MAGVLAFVGEVGRAVRDGSDSGTRASRREVGAAVPGGAIADGEVLPARVGWCFLLRVLRRERVDTAKKGANPRRLRN